MIDLVAGGLNVSLLPLGIARLHSPGIDTVHLGDTDRFFARHLIWPADRMKAVTRRVIAPDINPG